MMDGLNRNCLLISMAIILGFAGFTAGCIEEDVEKDLKWTDPTGNVLELESTPARVITLTPALTETVIELGAGELLVGADSVSAGEHSDLSLTIVSTYSGLDTEKLLETSADLVIMDKTLDITEAIFNSIVGLDMAVYRVFPTDPDSVISAIEDIGDMLDRESEAEDIISNIENRRDAIGEKFASVSENERPLVLYVTYYDGTDDPWVGTSSTFSGSLIEEAGGRCAISDDSGVGIQVSVETIIDSNPDIIITSQSSSWPTPSRTTILEKDTWQDITAVKNEEVHDMNADIVDRTGPGFINGMEEIHERLYPRE